MSVSGFIKNFLIYTISGLKEFNNENINDEENLSKNIVFIF